MKMKTESKTQKHTPGPWTITDEMMGPKGDYDAAIMARDGMTYIGGIVGDDRHGSADQWDSAVPVAEAQANARLIAAAPDLLSLLREVAECAEQNYNNNDMLAHDLSYITPRIAAILRATEGK